MGKPATAEQPKKAKRKKADADTMRQRERDFVLNYIANGFKGTEAAVMAGFSPRSAHVQATRLLKKDKVRSAIEALMRDKVMGANEALYRLSMHARADVTTFLGLSIDEIKKRQDSWLIKKIKATTVRHGDALVEERVEIEVHDPQSALGLIGKHLQLFVDRVEHTGAEGGAIEIRRASELSDDELAAMLQAMQKRA